MAPPFRGAESRARIDRIRIYQACGEGVLTTEERDRIRRILSLWHDGGARDPGDAALLRGFARIGALAVLDAGGGRGPDFAANQGMGAWAERLLEEGVNRPDSAYRLVRYGPTDDVIPGEGAYEDRRRQYREIEILEGKRPDFLLFPHDAAPDVAGWDRRLLTREERTTVRRHALAGIEVKSSEMHCGAFGGAQRGTAERARALHFTVKAEEIAGIRQWQSRFGLPIVLVQALFDQMHCLAFADFMCDPARWTRHDRTIRKSVYMVPLRGDSSRLARIDGGPEYRRVRWSPQGRVARPNPWPRDARLTGLDLTKLDAASAGPATAR
jgi:hypothetical protein